MAGDLIADYLARLGVRLPDSSAAAAVLAEVEDGLLSAAEDHVRRGADPEAAAELAVAEFGEPEPLAGELVPVLAAGEAHRTGVRLLATGPAVGVLWLSLAVLAWPVARTAVTAAAVAVGLALVAAVPCGVYAVAATGRLARRRERAPTAAVTAVSLTARAAMVLDAALLLAFVPALALLTGSHAGSHPGVAALAALAGSASLARLLLTTRALRRLHGVRAKLT